MGGLVIGREHQPHSSSLPVGNGSSCHSVTEIPSNVLVAGIGRVVLRFFLSSLPYYTQTHRTAFFPLSPHPLTGPLYFYDLIWLTRSRLVASCLVRYSSNVVIRSLMYDTYLRATHTTTSSIRGVQIPIYLVSDATDSLQRSAVVLKLYQ